MSRLFNDAASEYFISSAQPFDDVPATLACWFYPDADTGNGQGLVAVEHTSSGGNDESYIRLTYQDNAGGNPLRAQANDDPDSKSTTADTTGVTLNAWNHACATFNASGHSTIFLNGGGKTSDTSPSVSMSNPFEEIYVGAWQQTSVIQFASARIAEVGIWNLVLSDGEVLSLAKGVPPIRVRPMSIKAYYPLYARTGNAPDYSGAGLTLTDTNTVGIADHAPVGLPFGFSTMEPYLVSAAPGGLSIPVAMHEYRQRHQSVV